MPQTIILPNGIVLTEARRSVNRDSLSVYYEVSGATLPAGQNRIQLRLFYDLGGINYLSGRTSERGFYVSVVPVADTGSSVSQRLFAGLKKLLKPVSRFSAKTLPTLEDEGVAFMKQILHDRPSEFFVSEAA